MIEIFSKYRNNLVQNCVVLCETYGHECVVRILGVDVSTQAVKQEWPLPAIIVDDKYIGGITQLAKYLEEWDRVHGQ